VAALFSFLRNPRRSSEEPPAPDTEPVSAGAASDTRRASPVAARAARLSTMSNASTPAEALTHMLAALRSADYVSDLPNPSVSLVRVEERNLGLGNFRGTERRENASVMALKGGRLDAVVRFAFEDADKAEVASAVEVLQGRMLAARDAQWRDGFLRITAQDATLEEQDAFSGLWRKAIDYRVLYEFHYRELDAESLIARIPVEIDGAYGESFLVSDEMTRWDNLTAPQLLVRGRLTVRGFSAYSFLPGIPPAGTVTVLRTFSGAVGPPTTYPDWPTYQAAVTDAVSPDRHAQVVLASIPAFLASFAPSGDATTLGDWDEDGLPDEYTPVSLALDLPIQLERGESIQIAYADAALDTAAVLYLRARVRAFQGR